MYTAKCVLRRDFNVEIDCDILTSSGRLFQSLGALRANALLPLFCVKSVKIKRIGVMCSHFLVPG